MECFFTRSPPIKHKIYKPQFQKKSNIRKWLKSHNNKTQNILFEK